MYRSLNNLVKKSSKAGGVIIVGKQSEVAGWLIKTMDVIRCDEGLIHNTGADDVPVIY